MMKCVGTYGAGTTELLILVCPIAKILWKFRSQLLSKTTPDLRPSYYNDNTENAFSFKTLNHFRSSFAVAVVTVPHSLHSSHSSLRQVYASAGISTMLFAIVSSSVADLDPFGSVYYWLSWVRIQIQQLLK